MRLGVPNTNDVHNMIRDIIGQGLMDASTFQKQFAFDNDIMTAFWLDLMNMPSHLVGISNWGVIALKLLCGEYGVKREVNGRRSLF